MAVPVLEIAKRVGLVGEFHWSHERGGRTREVVRCQASLNWKVALSYFLEHFAYKRAPEAAGNYFGEAARKAVESYPGDEPAADFERGVWRKFVQGLSRTRRNERLNPLAPSKNKRTITSFVAGLAEARYNLFEWAATSLKEGQLEKALRQLRSVRGMGPWVCAYFLRDVGVAFEIDEATLEPSKYVQPLDDWVRRGAEVLDPKLAKRAARQPSDDDYVEAIVRIAAAADVSRALLNTGFWLLADLLGNKGEFEASLQSVEALHGTLVNLCESNRKWKAFYEYHF